MIRYIVFLTFSSLVVFTVSLSIRLGAFKQVEIFEATRGPVALVFKPHIGAYHKINSVIKEVEAWAIKEDLPCQRTFGEYIDDPKTNDESRLRSNGGCVLDGVESLTRKEALPKNYQIKILEQKNYVIARFSGSPAIGPFKVYPEVEEYFKSQRLKMSGPVIEIYSILNDKEALTEYLFIKNN
jgi:effector-binding domain-containing protein